MKREELLQLAEKFEATSQEGPNFLFKHVVTDDGGLLIQGDQEGLRMLISQILKLLARDYFDGVHQDFDVMALSDEGSDRMTIQRVERGLQP